MVALDTDDAIQAAAWSQAVASHADAIKLGLEFVYAQGLAAVCRIADGRALFLDIKLHDIPNTVAAATVALAPVRPAMLSVHAQGGAAMIAAARAACDATFPETRRPVLLAVTVLTSLDAESLHAVGVAGGPRQQVLRLARLALEAGADGLVCSAHEIALLRDAFGESPVLVVPGIRPQGAAPGDQKRVMTPRQAAVAGADWIVVGRPITRAADPGAAAAAIRAELA